MAIVLSRDVSTMEKKMKNKFGLADGIVLCVFIGIIFLQRYLMDRILDLDFFDSFLRYGAQISWLVAIFTLVFGDLNKNPDMISARPLEYLRGYALILSTVFSSLASILGQRRKIESPPVTQYLLLDSLFALLVLFPFSLFILAWIVLVIPIQYFVYVICGAPARYSLYSNIRIVVTQTGTSTTDDDWSSPDVSNTPVTLTAALSGFMIWLVQTVHSFA